MTDAAGRVLDGEWAKGANTFPSSNGAAGGAFSFRLNVVPGDVGPKRRNERRRPSPDLPPPGIVRRARRGHHAFYDVNGDGPVTAVDFAVVRANQLRSLPRREPATIPPALSQPAAGGTPSRIADLLSRDPIEPSAQAESLPSPA